MDHRSLLLITVLQEYLCIRPMRNIRYHVKGCGGTQIPAVRPAGRLSGPEMRLINFDGCLTPGRSVILALEPCRQ